MNRDNVNFSDIEMLRRHAANTIAATKPMISAYNAICRENKTPEAFFFQMNRQTIKRARYAVTLLRGL